MSTAATPTVVLSATSVAIGKDITVHCTSFPTGPLRVRFDNAVNGEVGDIYLPNPVGSLGMASFKVVPDGSAWIGTCSMTFYRANGSPTPIMPAPISFTVTAGTMPPTQTANALSLDVRAPHNTFPVGTTAIFDGTLFDTTGAVVKAAIITLLENDKTIGTYTTGGFGGYEFSVLFANPSPPTAPFLIQAEHSVSSSLRILSRVLSITINAAPPPPLKPTSIVMTVKQL
jgi:hypothetical protein